MFFDIWKDFSILAYQLFLYRPRAAAAAAVAATTANASATATAAATAKQPEVLISKGSIEL